MKRIIALLLFLTLSLSLSGMMTQPAVPSYPQLNESESGQTYKLNDLAQDDQTNLLVDQAKDKKPSRSLCSRFFRTLAKNRPAEWTEKTWASIGRKTWGTIGLAGVGVGLFFGFSEMLSALNPLEGCPPFYWNRTNIDSWRMDPMNWLVISCQKNWMPEFSNVSCTPIGRAEDGPIFVQTGPSSWETHDDCTLAGRDSWEVPQLYAACPTETWYGRLKQLLSHSNVSFCEYPVEDGVQVVVQPEDQEWVIDEHWYNFIATHPDLVRAKKCKRVLEIARNVIHRLNIPVNGGRSAVMNCHDYPYSTDEYKELLNNME